MTLRVGFDATPLVDHRQSGIATFTREVYRRLCQRPNISLSTYLISSRVTRDKLGALAESMAKPYPRWRNRFPARLALPLWTWSSMPSARWWLGKDVDALHGTNFILPPSRGRSREVLTVHDMSFVHYPDRGSTQLLRLISRCVERGTQIHVPSSAVGRSLQEVAEVDEVQIHVIRHGVPELQPETARGIERTRVLSYGRPYVLALGDMVPRKQFPLLVRSFSEVASTVPDVQLLIVGNSRVDSIEYEQICAAVDASGYSDRITLSNWVPEDVKATLVRRASALAYPSLSEGFGLPILEAQSVGVPVVTVSTGGISETVAVGGVESALLVKAGDETGLSAAIIAALTDEGERERLQILGTQNARQFSWEQCVDALVSLYRGDTLGAAS